MPSPRRVRLLLLAGICTALLIIVYSSRGRLENQSPHDFYRKTVSAIDNNQKPPPGPNGGQTGSTRSSGLKPLKPADRDRDGDIDAEDEILGAEMQERLREAEVKAKAKANEKAPRPDPPSHVIGVGSSADGQDGSSDKGDAKVVEEERDAEAELSSILKKSPSKSCAVNLLCECACVYVCVADGRALVIIFSKTYCPYSKRAKQILLDKYSITPEPHVVELDEMDLGSKLQDELKERTGRRTVPNILVNGVSLGGADEITALDEAGELMDKILKLGSKRIEMAKRPGSRGSRS